MPYCDLYLLAPSCSSVAAGASSLGEDYTERAERGSDSVSRVSADAHVRSTLARSAFGARYMRGDLPTV